MKAERVLALLMVGAIPTLLMVWLRTRQTTPFASLELVAYPLLFGGLGIVVVYALKRYLLGESVAELNRGAGGLLTDVLCSTTDSRLGHCCSLILISEPAPTSIISLCGA